jgi:hypothetical protein
MITHPFYFLTMKIISDKSRSMNLCGGGRGSGAGSLVSYLLNITEVDPIKYKLQFSRFIRNAPPVGEVFLESSAGSRKVSQAIKIETENGEIFVTPETSVKILRDGSEIYILAKNLKEGDSLYE